jgi:serine protease Do
MNTETSSPKTNRFRAIVLGSTALALVFGGAFVGDSLNFTQTPAYADPVQVQGLEPLSFADVVDKVRPAVVSVRVRSTAAEVSMFGDDMDEMPFFDLPEGSPMEEFFRQFRRQMPRGDMPRGNRSNMSVGSGFLISEDGYVVTNNHVIADQETVTVVLDDGSEYDAKVIGSDDKTDLSLLKIEDGNRAFTYVKFSDAEPRVGDWVVAVGNPFGLGGTVTAGIISAHGRQIGAGPYDDFLQIDAAVNRGNSGGPAFNFRGEVVGVNTAIFSPSGGNVGIAFAIPAATAEEIIDDLRDDGAVVRGWLGVQIQGINDDIAASLDLDQEGGALVADVVAGAPAADAGLEVGDAILAVNGEAVKDSRDLSLRISRIEPGETVKVTVWRDGVKQEIDVTLGTLPSNEELASVMPGEDDGEGEGTVEPSSLDEFGLEVAPSEDDENTVVVTAVDPNSQAAEQGIQTGDTILWVDNAPVASPDEVEQKIAAARSDGKEAILLRIKSGERTLFVPLSLARS